MCRSTNRTRRSAPEPLPLPGAGRLAPSDVAAAARKAVQAREHPSTARIVADRPLARVGSPQDDAANRLKYDAFVKLATDRHAEQMKKRTMTAHSLARVLRGGVATRPTRGGAQLPPVLALTLVPACAPLSLTHRPLTAALSLADSLWELLKTVAGTVVGFWIMMLLLVCFAGVVLLGVKELIKHKAKRYITEDDVHSPFRRGAKRVVKVD